VRKHPDLDETVLEAEDHDKPLARLGSVTARHGGADFTADKRLYAVRPQADVTPG
jgi:hypothetical protein